MSRTVCPACGERAANEVDFLGRKDQSRQFLPGFVVEEWYCKFGCTQIFATRRNTVTNEIFALEESK